MRQPEPWQVPPPSPAVDLVVRAVMGEPLLLWEKVELAALLRLQRSRPKRPRLRTRVTSKA
jgi:hypothetical protein